MSGGFWPGVHLKDWKKDSSWPPGFDWREQMYTYLYRQIGMDNEVVTHIGHLVYKECGTLLAGLGDAPHRSASSPARNSAAATYSACVWCWCRWARPGFESRFSRAAPSPRRPQRRGDLALLCKRPPEFRPHHPGEPWGPRTRRLLAQLCWTDFQKGSEKRGERGRRGKWQRGEKIRRWILISCACIWINNAHHTVHELKEVALAERADWLLPFHMYLH